MREDGTSIPPAAYQELVQRLTDDAEKIHVKMEHDQALQLAAYLAHLIKWNRVYNLTAIRQLDQMRIQHLLDSLATLPHLDARGVTSVIDIGTGGGLPGMVLAIMRPTWRVALNDIVQKKIAFLTQTKGVLNLRNVTVINGRVETLQDNDGYDAVISRAFAEAADFARDAVHLCKGHGALYAMKSQRVDVEASRLPDTVKLESVIPLDIPGLDAERSLLIMRPNR